MHSNHVPARPVHMFLSFIRAAWNWTEIGSITTNFSDFKRLLECVEFSLKLEIIVETCSNLSSLLSLLVGLRCLRCLRCLSWWPLKGFFAPSLDFCCSDLKQSNTGWKKKTNGAEGQKSDTRRRWNILKYIENYWNMMKRVIGTLKMWKVDRSISVTRYRKLNQARDFLQHVKLVFIMGCRGWSLRNACRKKS